MKEQVGPSDQLTDEEILEIRALPEYQAGLQEALAWLRDPASRSPGIKTEEELREFLREHG